MAPLPKPGPFKGGKSVRPVRGESIGPVIRTSIAKVEAAEQNMHSISYHAICLAISLMMLCRIVLMQRASPAMMTDSSGRASAICAFSVSISA